jgi:hypothetical protein
VKLRGNQLGGNGWGAIFAAICGNKDSKILFLDVSREDIGPAGGELIAEALRTSVTGALTSLDLSGNQLCGLDLYGRGTYTAEGITAIADALRVNGGLTSLDLSSNQLCGLDYYKRGTYTAEGITAIADALRVNGGLTSIDVRQNKIAGDGAVQLAAAVLGNLKIEMFNGIPIKEMRANSLTELDLNGTYVSVLEMHAADGEQQKQVLGECLFPLISQVQPAFAGKITGMLLEMDNGELLYLLGSPEALKAKIMEAVSVLEMHAAEGDVNPE